jgi:hypothetical protein
MRFLKYPQAKANEQLKQIVQNKFTALYEDIPASSIPESGVAKAENVLLYGDGLRVRPGSKK